MIYCKSSVEPLCLVFSLWQDFYPQFRIPRNIVSCIYLEMYTFHCKSLSYCHKMGNLLLPYNWYSIRGYVPLLVLLNLFVLSGFFPSLILVQVYKNNLMNTLVLFCYNFISISMIYSFVYYCLLFRGFILYSLGWLECFVHVALSVIFNITLKVINSILSTILLT